MYKIRLMRILLVVLSLALLVDVVNADEARMDNVVVTYDSEIHLSFEVRDAFTADIEEAIDSGIPTTFTFLVKLYRTRAFMTDKHIGTWNFKHTVKYDSLKAEYELTLEKLNGGTVKDDTQRTIDASEMKHLMVTGDDIVIKTGKALLSGKTYELKVMAELDPVELPHLLDYMFFFVKLWDFETDWFVYRFSF